jgi:hypothetical protein
MSDDETYVYQCAWCGTFTAPDDAHLYLVGGERLPDGRVQVRPGTYCSPYCGRQDASINFGAA